MHIYSNISSEPVKDVDHVYLLWINRKASGFITLRPCSDSFAEHDLDIIDTVFLRKNVRSQGHVTKFILKKLQQDPEQDLGFSQPVSNQMLRSLLRLLKTAPEYRDRIWIVDEATEERQMLWWSAKKIARQRDIDIKDLMKTSSPKIVINT